MHEIADEHTLNKVLSENDHLAEHNRMHFDELGLFVINLMSAPGAGKTALLCKTVPLLAPRKCTVIEGDMVGDLDAERLRAVGIQAHQISTGRSCHLDARMIARVIEPTAKTVDIERDSAIGRDTEFIFIENVGNLVCPAEFPLGEHKRVVLLSVTEGDDKPIKYPVIFRNCDAVIFTKTDLLPYVTFDVDKCTGYLKDLNANLEVFQVSAKDSSGLDMWKNWLSTERAKLCSHKQGGQHVHIHSR